MPTFTVHLHIHPEALEAFQTLTRANAEGSLQEPGCRAFEVLQQEDDPTRFMLVEVWASPEAHAAHRDTPHYLAWREGVEPLQAERRHSVRHLNLTPGR